MSPGLRSGAHRPPGWAPAWVPAAAGVLVTAALAGVVWASTRVHADEAVRDGALFAHIASLVVGLGAVLAVDWVGILWCVRRRTLTDVLRTAANLHVPVWGGYAGLLASGMILSPDLASTGTRVKLSLVLLVGLNGVLAGVLHQHLDRASPARPPLRLVVGAGVSTTVSQLGWWGAAVIGFIHTR